MRIKPVVAIIGGTGLESLPHSFSLERTPVDTPFGSALLIHAQRDGLDFLFLSRHGESHGLAPHEINYRANIAALVQAGVRQVLAANAVGSLRLDLVPGRLVLFDDFIDFTRGRPVSFWQGHPNAPEGVVHTDFSRPYCPTLRAALLETGTKRGLRISPRATYLCAEGPRFESPAEIRMFASMGADVVGMTGLPEAIFAREAGLCYAGVGIVTNFGAGLTDEAVDHAMVLERMAESGAATRDLLIDTAVTVTGSAACPTCAWMSSTEA